MLIFLISLFNFIESGLQKLSIREKEDAEFIISSEDIQREEINFELCFLWRPMRGAYIKPTGENNLYIIQFYHQVDLKRMLAGGPWSFNKYILLVHQWKEGEDPVNIDFTHTDVWAQFHGLPLGFASEALARNIGNLMGTYLEYDSANRRTDPMEIMFSYERLPLVCYLCSIIGHSETNYLKLLERSEEEHCREWPKEIQAEVRARNAQKSVQWKRDPGNDFGVDFATNPAPKFFPSVARNPHRIGNNFHIILKRYYRHPLPLLDQTWATFLLILVETNLNCRDLMLFQ
ncbi:hypothetical protein K2173_002017 [Erythroxylum novogranatense]|uniref:DUF4283 domain-containing protein n=1 Tax=Erythroxylum novogranatense TaxID=1862640 RepID=A0AAV8SQ83_9ROSI|nr:hypothetical protein K2173_002017 [Erythroxylum novogranatense]